MDRKEMVKRIGEHFGVKPLYLNVPTFAYEIRTVDETYTVDRVGNITNAQGEKLTLEEILNPPVVSEPENVIVEENEVEADSLGKVEGFELTLPMTDHTVGTLQNLINMISSKQHLLTLAFEGSKVFVSDTLAEKLEVQNIKDLEGLKQALESLQDELPGLEFDFENQRITFTLQKENETEEEKVAFKELIILMNQYAKTLKRASYKQAQDDNPKYALRTWLIRIGMNGPEYKETRKTLLKNLEGSGAFRKVGES